MPFHRSVIPPNRVTLPRVRLENRLDPGNEVDLKYRIARLPREFTQISDIRQTGVSRHCASAFTTYNNVPLFPDQIDWVSTDNRTHQRTLCNSVQRSNKLKVWLAVKVG